MLLESPNSRLVPIRYSQHLGKIKPSKVNTTGSAHNTISCIYPLTILNRNRSLHLQDA